MNRDVIINKTFTRAFFGYDAGEVDSFLDEVIREFDRIKQELDVARLRNKMLLEELERFHESAAEQKREQAAETEGEAKAEPESNEAAQAESEDTADAEMDGKADAEESASEQAAEHTEG